jgi:hypothetical protein
MASESQRFKEADGNFAASWMSLFVLALVLLGLICVLSPLQGSSPPLMAIALAFWIPAYGLWRVRRRMRQTALIASPTGVTVIQPWSRRELKWDEIVDFEPSAVAGNSMIKSDSIVVIRLRDGSLIPVQALRISKDIVHQRDQNDRAARLCQQIEALRPGGVTGSVRSQRPAATVQPR